VHRFFVSPKTLAVRPVVLRGEQARQIRRVLRLEPGDPVLLLDNRGQAYDAVLESYGGRDEARFDVVSQREAGGEPATHLTLYQAVLKGERFGWALQKGTELGVSRFVPLICERNVVDDMHAIEKRRDRWERILREAAEQSHRGRIPELAPAELFQAAVKATPSDTGGAGAPLRLIPWEGEQDTGLRQALASAGLPPASCNPKGSTRIEILIGPEGGFTAGEIDLARRYGVQPVTLGPRILRGETAGPVTAALILFAVGDI